MDKSIIGLSILLVLIGAISLLFTYGVVKSDVLKEMFRASPAILIIIGVLLLFLFRDDSKIEQVKAN